MYKSFLVLVFLVLFGSYSAPVAGQTTSDKSQTQKNINDPKNPINSVPMVMPAPKDRNAEAKELFREGMRLTEAGQLSQAVENLQQALGLDPEYADAYAALGRAYFKMREWQKALVNLRRAAELNTKQRPSQDALYRKGLMEESKEASIQVKGATISPQIKQEANAVAAAVKPLRPKSETTRQQEQQGEINTPVTVAPTSSQTKLPQGTDANAAGVKPPSPESITTRQPEQREEASTLATATTSPQINLPQETNGNAAAVKPQRPESEATRQPEQLRETSTSAKASSTSSQTKLPQETNGNAAAVKPLSPESETTRQPEQRDEVSTPAKAIPTSPQIKLPQETNGNAAGVKPPGSESEATRQPEQTTDGVPALKSNDDGASEQEQEPVGVRVSMTVTPASAPLEPPSASPVSTKTSSNETLLTRLYRIGPSDVLNVRINDSQSPQSTLFTVTPSGLLEHPMLPEPLLVTGFTAEEIGSKIEFELSKRALLDNPKVVVGVRDYASHTILVSGLVKESGTKFLRREAIPLYVVVADAQPLPQAARVTVVRSELNQIYEIDFTQAADMNLLIRPGDVITLHPNVMQFIYIGGEVKFPGEKTYRRGLTLTQAIISSGVTPKSKVAEIGRDDGRGFLVGTHFDLKDIQSGKAVDPLLKPGDRIMVLR